MGWEHVLRRHRQVAGRPEHGARLASWTGLGAVQRGLPLERSLTKLHLKGLRCGKAAARDCLWAIVVGNMHYWLNEVPVTSKCLQRVSLSPVDRRSAV